MHTRWAVDEEGVTGACRAANCASSPGTSARFPGGFLVTLLLPRDPASQPPSNRLVQRSQLG